MQFMSNPDFLHDVSCGYVQNSGGLGHELDELSMLGCPAEDHDIHIGP